MVRPWKNDITGQADALACKGDSSRNLNSRDLFFCDLLTELGIPSVWSILPFLVYMRSSQTFFENSFQEKIIVFESLEDRLGITGQPCCQPITLTVRYRIYQGHNQEFGAIALLSVDISWLSVLIHNLPAFCAHCRHIHNGISNIFLWILLILIFCLQKEKNHKQK